MLGVNQLIGFGNIGFSGPQLALTATSLPGLPPSSTHTHPAVSTGTAAADRYLVVAFCANNASVFTVSGVTIGGSAATVYQTTVRVGGSNYVCAGFAVLLRTTGTSDNVDITFSVSVSRSALAMYALTGLNSGTPVDSDTVAITSGTLLTIPTLTTQAGGFVISVMCARTASITNTWTTVTEDVDDTSWGGGSNHPFSAGHANTPSTTIDVTDTVSSSIGSVAVASAITFR